MFRNFFIQAISLLPISFLLSLGQLTLAEAKPPTVELNYENNRSSGSVRSGSVLAMVQYRKQISDTGLVTKIPTLVVSVDNKQVVEVKGAEEPDFQSPNALVQIAEMDSSNPYPEVIFSSYSGGAHCCNVLKIATSSSDGSQWNVVDVGSFDGGPKDIEDPDKDELYEIVESDNRFLYKFNAYAFSYPPLEVLKLVGNEVVDVTKEPRFRPLHRERLKDIWESGNQYSKDEPNGWLAGYVATKALLGEEISGWELMLKRYNTDSTWGLEECKGDYDSEGNCKGEVIHYDSFPQALRAFLINTGYLNP